MRRNHQELIGRHVFRRARAALFACAVAALTIAGVALGAACGDEETDPARAPTTIRHPDGTITLADGAVVQADGAPVVPVDDAGDLEPPRPFIDAGKAFDFAPPYVATLGPSSRSDAGHNFANTPPSNPRGTICITCHKVGGTPGAMPFFAGGSVKVDGTNATPVASAEVRLKAYVSANAVTAYTDVDGNWFIPKDVADDAGVGFSVRPGIRNQTAIRMMGASPAVGTCNKCHIAQL